MASCTKKILENTHSKKRWITDFLNFTQVFHIYIEMLSSKINKNNLLLNIPFFHWMFSYLDDQNTGK